jgi:hypothetical protein
MPATAAATGDTGGISETNVSSGRAAALATAAGVEDTGADSEKNVSVWSVWRPAALATAAGMEASDGKSSSAAVTV